MFRSISANILNQKDKKSLLNYSEIKWIKKIFSEGELNNIKNELNKNIIIYLPNINQCIRLFFKSEEIKPLLEEKYMILSKAANNIPEIFFIERLEKENEGFIYNGKWNKCVLYGNWFGILKSVISGYSTYLDKWSLPIHASIIETDIGAIAFVWWHRAWKTTTLLSLIEVLEKFNIKSSILTDDWANLKMQWNNAFVTSPDPSISLRANDIMENNFLQSKLTTSIQEMIYKRKVSLSPDKIYGFWYNINKCELKSLIFLSNTISTDIKDVLLDIDLWKFIVESAYHYPYISSYIKKKHIEKWNTILPSLRLASYSREKPLNKFIDELVNNLFLHDFNEK